jgi:hypothetical protein
VQQQSASGSGPVGQQQVATTPSGAVRAGNAANIVTTSGNIIQHAGGN